MSFNLFIDCIKSGPSGWQNVCNFDDAVKCLDTNNVNIVSVGDVGGQEEKIVRYMVDHGIYPYRVIIHSMNPVGRKNMFMMLLKYGNYRVVRPWRELEKNR